MSDTIFRVAMQSTRTGKRVVVNIPNRTVKIDGVKVIDRGDYSGNLGLRKVSPEVAFRHIEEAYEQYKYSSPQSGGRRNRCLFKALKEDELNGTQILECNEEARTRLEMTVLIYAMNGSLVIPEGMWYWQSKKDKDLVILKEWLNK